MERSNDWMDQAEGDLEHAKSDKDHGFYNWACFSAQQAAEKAEGWGRSIADLLEALSTSHEVPQELKNAALELDKAYIPTRYPNALPSGSPRRRYTKGEAERLIKHATEIVGFCSDLLSRIG